MELFNEIIEIKRYVDAVCFVWKVCKVGYFLWRKIRVMLSVMKRWRKKQREI